MPRKRRTEQEQPKTAGDAGAAQEPAGFDPLGSPLRKRLRMQAQGDAEAQDQPTPTDAPDTPALARARVLHSSTSFFAAVSLRKVTISDWLALGFTPRECAAKAVREWQMDRSTANRYVGAVLQMFVDDAQREPMPSKRARFIAKMQARQRMAMEQKRSFLSNGELIEYPCPNFKAAAAFSQLEALAEGLAKPGA